MPVASNLLGAACHPLARSETYAGGHLAGALLTYNPNKRLSAAQALEHPMFDRVRSKHIELPPAVLAYYCHQHEHGVPKTTEAPL
jgi:serine/threonine protein kinase